MVLGYNVEEEVKEIGSELKSSRGDLVIGIVSFVAGTLMASVIRDRSVIETVKSWFGYDQEEYEGEEE